MVDKIQNPPAAEDTAPAVADSTATTSDSTTPPLTVSNEEMAEHFKSSISSPSNGTLAEEDRVEIGIPKPADKYLPNLEFDFGDETGSGGDAPDGGADDAPEDADADEAPEAKQKNAGEATPEVPGAKPEVAGVKPEVAEAKPEAVEAKADAPELKGEPTMTREQVQELAKETIKDPEALAEFQRNVETFEKRAETDKLSTKDREEFYGQVGRVLNESKTGNDIYSSKELQTIGSDMMRQAAKPGVVNQGATSTCTTAALEAALYMQEPATIARLVSDIAMTGEYKTNDGSVVKVPESNLHIDKYKADTPADKARSLASHLAQPELINIHWNSQSEFAGSPSEKGKIRYEEGHPSAFMGDSHTRMMDYSKDPPRPFTREVGISDPTREGSGLLLLEDRPIEGPAMHMDYLRGVYDQLRGNKGDLKIVSGREGAGVIKPENQQQLEKILMEAHEQRKPVILGVHANRGPFLDDLNDSYSGKPLTAEEKEQQQQQHAHHALVATDIDPTTGRVTVENQWGNRVDHTGLEGQREKLAVATVFDTVEYKEDKPADPNAKPVERKKPTPEEHIKSQSDFVKELEKDDKTDPSVLFNQRMTLHRYLNHFGQKEEAQKVAETLSKSLEDRLKSATPEKNIMDDVRQFMGEMGDEGKGKELGKRLLTHTDEMFKRMPASDKEYQNKFKQHLDLHTRLGDKEGAKALAHDVVTNVINEHAKPEKIGDRDSRYALSGMVDTMLDNDLQDEAQRVADGYISSLRSYEQQHGRDNKPVAETKYSLMYFGRDDSFKEMKAQIASEMAESYAGFKAKGDTTNPVASEYRFGLQNRYEMTRQPEKLEALFEDNVHHLMTEGGRNGKYTADSPELVAVYKNCGERLGNAGGKDIQIEWQKKALDLAKRVKPDDVEELATNLVYMLDGAGKSLDGDKIAKDNGIEPRFRRRAKGQ